MFPTRECCESAPLQEVQRCSQIAVNVIKAAKPYKGEALWVLDQLDNSNKHQILTTVAFGFRAASINVSSEVRALMFPDTPLDKLENMLAAGQTLRYMFPDGPIALNEGAELYRMPAAWRDKVDVEPELTFDVALNEPRIIKVQRLIPLLNKFLNLVDGIVTELATI